MAHLLANNADSRQFWRGLARRSVLLLTAVFASLGAAPALAASAPTGPAAWQELRFHASKFGLQANSAVERQWLGSDENAARSAVKLSIESSYVGRTSNQELIFDPSGRVLFERSWRNSGASSYMNERLYEFDAIWRHRRAPTDKTEAQQSWSAWTDIHAWGESYPEGSQTCNGFTDTAALLHYLPALGQIPADACFIADDSLWHLEIEELGTETVEASFTDARQNRQITLDQPLELRKIAIRPTLRRGPKDSKFQLLGLRGDLIALLHPTEGFPVQFTGNAPVIGKLTVSLTSIR